MGCSVYCLSGNLLLMVGERVYVVCDEEEECVDVEEMMRKGKEQEEMEALLICTY